MWMELVPMSMAAIRIGQLSALGFSFRPGTEADS
jgi:hypothetical protein